MQHLFESRRPLPRRALLVALGMRRRMATAAVIRDKAAKRQRVVRDARIKID